MDPNELTLYIKLWNISLNTCPINIILEYPYLEDVTVNHTDIEHFSV